MSLVPRLLDPSISKLAGPPAERKVETMRIGALLAMLAFTTLPASHAALAAEESRPVMSGTHGSGAPGSGATLRQFLATAPGVAMRHSGTVVGIAPDRSSITISETVAWRGPGTGVVERTIAVAEATQVHLVMRDETSVSRDDVPGYRELPASPSDLAPGDFVTVTTLPDRTAAIAIDVWRPASEAGVSASPGSTEGVRELPARELAPRAGERVGTDGRRDGGASPRVPSSRIMQR